MEYRECSERGCGNRVFARSLCRKHYERDRLERADPCSFQGCKAPATKRGMCESHYQSWRIKQNPPCKVKGCSGRSRGKKYGLCQKHEFRMRRHTAVSQPRPDDWGAREEHPLYKSWLWHRRVHNLCPEWEADFWVFVDAVGGRPEGHTLRRKDTSKPFDDDNWHWKASTPSKDKAAYARKWRAKNPRKAKNADLKKHYGITIDDYERMFDEQHGVCAICKKPERGYQRDSSPSSLVVDHCHATKNVRGLLCHHCNRGLGFFDHDPETLQAAIDYLLNYE